MADGTTSYDILLKAMEQAQEWVKDALTKTPGVNTGEERIEQYKQLYQQAITAIAAAAREGIKKYREE